MIDANGGWQDKKGSAATRGQGLRKQSGRKDQPLCPRPESRFGWNNR